MPGRLVPLVNGEYYHVFNRGNDKRDIFLQPRDYKRFLQTFYYYQFAGPKPKFSQYAKSQLNLTNFQDSQRLVEIICFCLMPNHFHFLLKQVADNGISIFLSQVSNSYTKYFNTKYAHTGALLQGVFKSVLIESEEQFIHVSRYIHLNPLVSGICSNLETYRWSSYKEYITGFSYYSSPEEVLRLFLDKDSYKEFLENQIDYGTSLELIKHHIFD